MAWCCCGRDQSKSVSARSHKASPLHKLRNCGLKKVQMRWDFCFGASYDCVTLMITRHHWFWRKNSKTAGDNSTNSDRSAQGRWSSTNIHPPFKNRLDVWTSPRVDSWDSCTASCPLSLVSRHKFHSKGHDHMA